MHTEPFSPLTRATASVLQRGAEASHGDDGKRPEKVLVKPLQREHKVVHVGHAVSLAAQPAYQFEAQLCGEAAQVAKPHLLQEVAGVAPQHHVDVHVLCALPITTVWGIQERRRRLDVTAAEVKTQKLFKTVLARVRTL